MDKKDLVLRIGVIESGKIIEEFIVKDKKDVTLGKDIKNSIVLNNSKLSSKSKLFTYSKGIYYLHTEEFMLVTINSDVIKEKKVIELDFNARGKIDISDKQRILFQFIEKPEELIIPKRLPKEFRNKLTDYIDWKFLIPLFVSFVIHLIWMLWMYSLDLSYVEELDMAKIPDRFREVIIEPEKKDEPIKESEDTGDGEDKVVKKIEKQAVQKDISKMTKEEKKTYARKTVKGKSKVLTALDKLKNSSSGGFGAIGMNNAGSGGNSLDSLAELDSGKSISGSGGGDGFGSGGSGIGVRGTGTGGSGSGYTRNSKQNTAPQGISTKISNDRKEVTVKKKKRVAISKTNMKADIKVDKNLTKASAQKAIKKSQRKVNSCYQRETKKNNSFAGRVTISIMVGAGGKAISVDIINSRMNDASLEKSLISCIKSKLKRIKFPTPEKPPVQIKFTAAFSSGS